MRAKHKVVAIDDPGPDSRLAPGRAGLVMLGAFIALVLCWTAAGLLVYRLGGDVLVRGVDRPLLDLVHEGRPSFDGFMTRATDLGSNVLVGAILVASAFSTIRSTRPWTLYFAVCFVGALLLHPTVKLLVQRPRPQIEPLVIVGGFSFPSGHATAAGVLFASLALAAWVGRVRFRAAAMSLAAVLSTLVAYTRVYLGVHWPTDVVAGLLLSTAWALVAGIVAGVWAVPERAAGILPRTWRRGRVA